MKNCEPEDLDAEITNILKAFNDMTQIACFKRISKGWYRSLEITHNLTDDTFHPHIHCVIAVNPSYFKLQDYLSQEKWTSLWKHALNADYTPVVDVRKIKGDTAKAVAEVAKYSVKSNDYIIPNDWDLTVETVRILDAALHKRRLVAFGGIFKQVHNILHLDKPEEGDLVNIDGQAPSVPSERLLSFVWYSGFRQYLKAN